jgi:hypothetical protein
MRQKRQRAFTFQNTKVSYPLVSKVLPSHDDFLKGG